MISLFAPNLVFDLGNIFLIKENDLKVDLKIIIDLRFTI